MISGKEIVIILLISPFLLYAGGQFIPQYDGFVVNSGSMEPEIDTGALLFTYKTGPENIGVADTITFQDEDSYTTHKVIEKNTGEEITFKTQGIANNSPDPGEVTVDEIAGKKLFSIPFLGYVITWAGTTTGIIVLIVIPGIIVAAMEIRKIIAEVGE